MTRSPGAVAATLVAYLAVLVASGWATGTLLVDVAGVDGAVRVDQVAVGYLVERRIPWLTTTLGHATWLGTAFVLLPFVGVVGVAVRRRTTSWAPLVQLGVSLGGAIVVYDAVKVLVARPRPHVGQLVSTATGFAFPSGHATQIAAITVTITLLGTALPVSRSRRALAWGATALIVLVVGVSRIYLGVHWPTDVLAGSALGALWAVLTVRTLRPSMAHRGSRKVDTVQLRVAWGRNRFTARPFPAPRRSRRFPDGSL